MSVREEIERIISESVVIRNLEQLSMTLRFVVLDVKEEVLSKFGYEPMISECLYLIYTGKSGPDKCLLSSCNNNGIFRGQVHKGDAGYRYCCKNHSDTDPVRNSKIQTKRLPKIDYKEVHKKVVKTKNDRLDENGLNVHQRSGLKTQETRNENYDNWYKATCDAQKSISTDTRRERSKKRQTTIDSKYGVSHFGGGLSRIKQVQIFGKLFNLQGYEDIEIYRLVESGYKIEDIEIVCQRKEYKIEYIFEGHAHFYYPDILIKSENRFIEVKSDYWYNKEKLKTDTKIKSAKDLGINIDLIVYGKGDKSEIQRIRKNIKRVE